MIISGDVHEIRFRNEENGYTISIINCNGENVVAVGNFPPVSEGETVRLSGDFVIHPKFGRQFRADKITKTAPDSKDAIVKFLGSGIIKGVGSKLAHAIVATFGLDSLNIIEYNPLALAKIRGISRNKASDISKSYRENKNMQEAIMFLQDRNISLNLAIKIHKRYGINTITTVASNPYKLIEDLDGIGFITADKIASEMGIGKDSAFRIRAIILFTLKESSEKFGNTYLPIDELVVEVSRLCTVTNEKILQHIDELMIDRKLKVCKINDDTAVMTMKAYVAEHSVAAALVKLNRSTDKTPYNCESDIDEFERVNRLSFHSAQREAIERAINNGVTIITGGPGTGKTTILKCFLQICEKLRLKPLLMAPTGRAAKRLYESTGFEASTIHRALMMKPENENTTTVKLNADVVLIDEFSMVDIYLFHSLLKNVAGGTKLVFVGDKNQLPSVGAGNCLKNLLDSRQFPSVNLTKIYRQSEKSLISLNAHAINNGEMPELATSSSSDFFFLKCSDQALMASKIVELYCERIPKYLGIEPSKIQILCAVKNGIVGANSLNSTLQEILNPKTKQDSYPHVPSGEPLNKGAKRADAIETFRVGDKVMHIANNYNLKWRRSVDYFVENGEGVFNGDIGTVYQINKDVGSIDVELEDGRQVNYTPDIIEQLTLAYAITIHKSQGSEFDAAIVPITLGSPVIMTRNLLYTAITRAKRMVVLVGEEYSIRRMVDNNYIAKRYSALDHFLKETKNDMDLLYELR